jgi:hypothetical protein
MTRTKGFTIATTLVAVIFLMLPGKGWTAELPEGVSIDVLAEYASKTQGVEKILFRRITLRPGASWTFTVPAQSLCHATKGELEVADQTTGENHTFKAGDRWDTSPGHKVTLSNKGSVDHEHLFYTMIVKK